jgi:hypothetical protein
MTIRRYFSSWEVSHCSGVALTHDLYRTMGNIDVCIEPELLEIIVPIVFLGMVSFSLLREGRK